MTFFNRNSIAPLVAVLLATMLFAIVLPGIGLASAQENADSIKVEAESFVATGDPLSPERADCAGCSGAGKINFFWPNSWFEVEVSVPVAGEYRLALRASNDFPDDSVVNVTDAMGNPLAALTVAPTVGWDDFRDTSAELVVLVEGTQTLRFTNTSAAADIDYLMLTPELPVEPEPTPELPVEPEPTPELPVEPEPTPELPVEPEPTPELPVEPEPTPELPVEPEPTPELPVEPEPTPELPVEPEPTPELPVEPEPTPELPVEPEATPALPAEPGRIEAETFTSSTAPNEPQKNQCTTCSGGTQVDYFWPGIWFELEVNAPEAGAYDISLQAANNFADPAIIDVSVLGAVATSITVPPGGYADTAVETVLLDQGTHVLRFTNTSAVADIDYVTFVPKAAIDPSTLTEAELDQLSADAIVEVVDALVRYQQQNGETVVLGAGWQGQGTGLFHGSSSDNYKAPIASTLVDQGFLNALLLPKNPRHLDVGVPSGLDFVIRRCGERLGIFVEALTLAPTAEDQAWWTANGCSVDAQRNYFALTTDQTEMFDALRKSAVEEVVIALTSYQQLTASTTVAGTGWNANGTGLFHGSNNANYVAPIAAALVERGLLDSANLPKNPRHLDLGVPSGSDFMIRRCGERLGVFVAAPTLSPTSEDQAWWTNNECSVDTQRNYFALTIDQTQFFDSVRSGAVFEIVAALNAYQSLTGMTAVADTGWNGRGEGLFYGSDSTNYVAPIGLALMELGVLDVDNLPKNPRHVTLDVPSGYDFFIRRCGERLGVFVEAPTLSPSAQDQAWWTDNECNLDDRRNHFVLTGNPTVEVANPPVNAGPPKNPLKGWNSGWWAGADADNLLEVAFAEMTTVGYQTLAWRDWEPDNDGTFNTQAVEDLLDNRAGSVGRHVILQFHVDWSEGEFKGPGWLLNDVEELEERRTYKENGDLAYRATNYDDPDFIREAEEAVTALLTQYGDDPRIHIIQIGLLGYWGEWHTHPEEQWGPSEATQQFFYDLYKANIGSENFLQARSPQPYENAITVPTPGMGYTNGWIFPDLHGSDFGDYIGKNDLWVNGPVGGEWPPNRLPENNEGGTQADWVNFFTNTGDSNVMNGLEFFQTGHYSHAQPPKVNDIQSMIPGWTTDDPFFQEIHRALGYNFQVSNITHAFSATGSQMNVSLDVVNSGIAPFYEDWDVQLAVLDDTGQVVGDVIALDDADVRTWMPGDRTTLSVAVDVDGDPNGSYRLGLRILQPGAEDAKTEPWKLDARNTYIVVANDVDVIHGAWVENKLVGGWNVLDDLQAMPAAVAAN